MEGLSLLLEHWSLHLHLAPFTCISHLVHIHLAPCTNTSHIAPRTSHLAHYTYTLYLHLHLAPTFATYLCWRELVSIMQGSRWKSKYTVQAKGVANVQGEMCMREV